MKVNYICNKLHARITAFRAHPLTRGNVVGALYRYISFNTIQSLSPRPRIYKWIGNLRFYAQKGDAGIVANIYFKLFDYEDSMFLMDHLKPDDLFVDVGANVGHFSLLAAGVCGANVMAFEPIPTTFLKLKKNSELNALETKVSLFNLGLGDRNDILKFTKNRDVMNAVALEHELDVLNAQVRTLDELLTGKTPTFLKIDVEGFEFNVLKGALKTLNSASLKYIIIELNSSSLRYGYSSKEIFDYLTLFNFVPITYDISTKEVIKQKSFNTEKFNTIFMKQND
ncbi:hypothetical protein FFWV33_07960 [Flavobacterium faecale]|uniref:Methyltransferase FkbM domain-containing protein n=1 Tax=Flavobacterium faecale TaxID=1355330 RepID=A0A2S1LCL3_9FLAO|nr:FkbM family methyltransferase [Flavobacterium faecale]AWG21474.1 hypothetical protein FFWV33_07960 [Flavobacterium faecale]